jgi:hypothetical protein
VLALTRTRDPDDKHHNGQDDEHAQPSDHHVERSSLGFGPVSTETNLGVAGQVPVVPRGRDTARHPGRALLFAELLRG